MYFHILLTKLVIIRIMTLERNPIILVANKADMVRNRKVKARLGKELATVYNIKYIETSSGWFSLKLEKEYFW